MLAGEIESKGASYGKGAARVQGKLAGDAADPIGTEKVAGCCLRNGQASILQKENRARRRDGTSLKSVA
jgi:hypothetical protein